MPPRTQVTSDGITPKSSASSARAQTIAVSCHSGIPTRRPFRSCGVFTRSRRTQIDVCRNARDTKAGIATYGQSRCASFTQ